MRYLFITLAAFLLFAAPASAATDTVEVTVQVPTLCAILIEQNSLDFVFTGLTPCDWTYMVDDLDFQICCNETWAKAVVSSSFAYTDWDSEIDGWIGLTSTGGWTSWDSWAYDFGATPMCANKEVFVQVGVYCDVPPRGSTDPYNGTLTLTLVCSN